MVYFRLPITVITNLKSALKFETCSKSTLTFSKCDQTEETSRQNIGTKLILAFEFHYGHVN